MQYGSDPKASLLPQMTRVEWCMCQVSRNTAKNTLQLESCQPDLTSIGNLRRI